MINFLKFLKNLFNKDKLMDIIPKKSETFEEQINAITRFIIYLTFILYFITFSVKYLVYGILTIVLIIAFYYFRKQKMNDKTIESFVNFYKENKGDFTEPTKKNPLMNVLLPEIQYDPKREPAAPSFAPDVVEQINNKASDSRLFGDLGDNIAFENSMRNFYSNPSTTIPNDQNAFADFLYGNMPSCKEGDPFQCVKNNTGWFNVFY
mgnify:CR=1 FL=1